MVKILKEHAIRAKSSHSITKKCNIWYIECLLEGTLEIERECERF